MVNEIGWMVLEIQEGGNPPNLADSLGIESSDYMNLLLNGILYATEITKTGSSPNTNNI